MFSIKFRSAFLALLACGAVVQLRAGEPLPHVEGLVSQSGVLQLRGGGRELCAFQMGLFEKGWKWANATTSYHLGANSAKRGFKIKAPGGAVVNGEAEFDNSYGNVSATYQFTPLADVELNSMHVSAEFAVEALAGGKWTADKESGQFPSQFKDIHLFVGTIRELKLELPSPAAGEAKQLGYTLTILFAEPTPVLLQDNRQWGATFSVRIGPQNDQGATFKKGEAVKVRFSVMASRPIQVTQDTPTTIVAGPEWTPLNLELDIEPGSALDFSGFGFHDAPAGKHGRVIAREDGQFAFEKDPGTPRRFYGVNFCFSANFITHEQSDILAERLMRLGYNAIRIHHHEGELVSGQADSTKLNPEKMDQLDYLLAACAKRGIYVTTDLFVSRPVKFRDIGMDKAGNVEMDTFKCLIAVVPAAFENWKAFTRALLTHENPHRKMRWADDPALAWLAMINEGNLGNFLDRAKPFPEWNSAWNKWLAARYANREALAAAWKKELKDNEDPANGNVALPGNIYASNPRVYDCAEFLSETERDMIRHMNSFLCGELGREGLNSNMSSWTNHLSDQTARSIYHYVDDHFYIDHPHFLEQSWRLPSRCDNKSPIAGGASGGRHTSFTRLFDKPFTITEYNYSAPGRFRGVGGILTGALGALQGWGGVWRFAYSHNKETMFKPGRMDYFNMANDPLGQAAERASLCLYLRGDMRPAPHSVALIMTEKEALGARPMPKLAPAWHWMAWLTRVGTQVIADDKAAAGHTALVPVGDASRALAGAKAAEGIKPYGGSGSETAAKLLALLKVQGILKDDNPTDPSKNIFRSETGEITIDGPRNVMILDTPKTAGGYSPAGETISTADKGLTISIQDSDATAWVSSLDNQPIASSKRLLITHLTDLQNTEIKYAEKARRTLLDWGKLPHLVRNGKAAVSVKLQDPQSFKVWALSTNGKRLAEVAATAADGRLQFTADVAADAASGARMMYEVARE